MYFEPTKKTYYRFPSSTSTQNFEAKHYYPDQSKAFSENNRFEAGITGYTNVMKAHTTN